MNENLPIGLQPDEDLKDEQLHLSLGLLVPIDALMCRCATWQGLNTMC